MIGFSYRPMRHVSYPSHRHTCLKTDRQEIEKLRFFKPIRLQAHALICAGKKYANHQGNISSTTRYFFIRKWSLRDWGYRGQNCKKLKGCITQTLRNWSVVNSRNCIFGVHKNTISEQILRLKCQNSYIEVSLSIIFNFICLSAICYAMKLGMDIIQGQYLS